MLEKELAYLGSVCAAALMKKDLALPIGMETVDELNHLFLITCFYCNPFYQVVFEY